MRLFAAPLGLTIILLAAGCSSSRDAGWQNRSELGRDYPSVVPPVSSLKSTILKPETSGEGLTLRRALSLALLHNQELLAFGWEVRASEAHALQVGLLPNPEVGFEVENVGGTGSIRGTRAAEYTIGLSQLIELGGERGKRRNVALRQQELSTWDYEIVRLDVFTVTAKNFVRLLAAQERMELADSLTGVAQRFYESVSLRVDAGKVSALDERRAGIQRSLVNAEQRKAERDVQGARAALASMWAETDPSFENVLGTLELIEAVPELKSIIGLIENNPAVARWTDEIALRTEILSYEKSKRVPNPTIMVGVRRLREIGETGAVAGISIPLNIFNRNQGEIREAEYRLRQGEALRRAATVFSTATLSETHAALKAAEEEVKILTDEVLPAARENLGATEVGYREGKFDFLMVLDAQRTLFQASNRAITALELFHSYLADVERLLGAPLNSISTQE